MSGESESADMKAAEKVLEILDKLAIEKKNTCQYWVGVLIDECPFRYHFQNREFSSILNIMSEDDRNFSAPYNLRGMSLYMWFVVD